MSLASVLGSYEAWPPQGQEAIAASFATLMRLEAKSRILQIPVRLQPSPSATVAAGLQARGMEHAESRLYQAGDDARTIDWKVTARQSRPYTKLYRREREHPIWVVVDLRASMFFATRTAYKSVFATHTAALLFWTIQRVGDQAGCLCFTETGWRIQPPKRGRAAVEMLLRMLSAAASPGPASSLQAPSPSVPVVRPRGDAVYVLSDFSQGDPQTLMSPWSDSGPNPKRVAVVQIFDPIEADLPPVSEGNVVDRAGERWALDTRPAARARHRQQFAERSRHVQATVASMGGSLCRFATNANPLDAARRLLAFSSDPLPT